VVPAADPASAAHTTYAWVGPWVTDGVVPVPGLAARIDGHARDLSATKGCATPVPDTVPAESQIPIECTSVLT